MNPKGRGEASEAAVLAALVKRGWAVALPFGDNQRWDMVVERDEQLYRAQVKTARWLPNGSLDVPTVSRNGFTGEQRRYLGEIDVVLAYWPEQDRTYWIPAEVVGDRKHIALRVAPAKGGPRTTSHVASDYELR